MFHQANVLISDEGIAKLTDFGCTTLRGDATVQFTHTGTINFSLRWAVCVSQSSYLILAQLL